MLVLIQIRRNHTSLYCMHQIRFFIIYPRYEYNHEISSKVLDCIEAHSLNYEQNSPLPEIVNNLESKNLFPLYVSVFT